LYRRLKAKSYRLKTHRNNLPLRLKIFCVKKQQLILLGGGLLLLSSLLFFGKTVAKKDPATTKSAGNRPSAMAFNIANYISDAKKKLSIPQLDYVNKLENSISRGDVKEQQIKVYNQLATFWDDSLHEHELHLFYTSESAKLVNSEKNLTFAAQMMLDDLRNESNAALRGWKSEQAVDLFERAIAINPDNVSLKVGLGSCYVFGKGMAGDPQETMKGIQQLLQVVRNDSMNMQAQLVLGIGGVISNQYSKAVDRLLFVVKNQPSNLEAVSWLADAYAGIGDKPNALKWYEISKRMVNNPAYSKEVDERIKMLK
jgi:tetratricopeptide (TPR) repeat protein